VQTIGRAARNVEGRVVMYADRITDSMAYAIGETNRRRGIQEAYNIANGITPATIIKKVHELIRMTVAAEPTTATLQKDPESMNHEELLAAIKKVEKQMKQAAAELNFEMAAQLRDELLNLRKYLN
jgi:excinuclease ABC subunit B